MSQRQRKASYWQDAPMPRDQLVLIPTSLEDSIAGDHPVRMVDELLDKMDWKQWESKYHGSMGQPPIHPSVQCKVILFAMTRKVRSSRQIEYMVKHSMDFIWLTSGRSIDHGTIAKFRRAHAVELKQIFRQLVTMAMDLGLANLAELCIDGTRVLADANKYKTWTVAKVEKVLEQLDAALAAALDEVEKQDSLDEDVLGNGYPADKLPPELADITIRRAKLAEQLAKLQEMEANRAKNGIDASKNPAQLPMTDPDSRILPNKEGGYAPNYTPMVTTESTNGFIVDADVVIGNVEHDQVAATMDQVAIVYGVQITSLLADSAYTTGANLTACEERGIEMHGPMAEVKCTDNPALRETLTEPVAEADVGRLPINPQTKRFDKSAFVYDEVTNTYYCPAGNEMPYRHTEKCDRGDRKVLRDVFRCDKCVGCPLLNLCRKNPDSAKGREVAHDADEPARRRHRQRMKTPEAQAAYARRQHPGETPFAVIKCLFDMRRFLLRGIEGVKTEWLWAATAFNLKKLASLIGKMRAAQAEMALAAAA